MRGVAALVVVGRYWGWCRQVSRDGQPGRIFPHSVLRILVTAFRLSLIRLFWAVLESGYFGILDFGDFGAFGTEFGGLGPSGQACGLEAGNEAYEKRMT